MKPLASAVLVVPALALAVAASMATVSVAHAEVRKEGVWPANEPGVSFSVDGAPKKIALRQLASAAGWSIVTPAGLDDAVEVVARDQPPERVLSMLLEGGNYVAKREGSLVSIRVDASPPPAGAAAPVPLVPPVPPTPPVSPLPADPAIVPAFSANPAIVAPSATAERRAARGKRAGDRTVAGGSARILAGETVRDVQVMGGTLDVEGVVTGDIEVLGGTVRIRKGARVDGDISALGGTVTVDEGADVKGGVETVGAVVARHDTPEEGPKNEAGAVPPARFPAVSAALSSAGSAISSSALLFVFGAVLMALLTKRMDSLRVETAARPMRTFALGVVGSLASVAVLVALCVTVIGIPIAMAAVVVGVLVAYAGICAVLQTAGEALLRHRTPNPYVHLACGCLIFLIAGSLPWIGGYVTAIVALLGIGAVVATRLGTEPRDRQVEDGAYRSAV